MTIRFNSRLALITVVAFAATLPFTASSARAGSDSQQVRLLFNSSVQAKLHDCGCKSNPMGGLARRAALVQQLSQNTNTITLLDGGNLLPAAGSADMVHAAFFADATAELGYQAVGIGPHDLARGVQSLHYIASESGLQFVSANLETNGTTEFASYTILDHDGLRIAFTSVVAPELLDSETAEDPATALGRLLPELHQRADLVVVSCSLAQGQTVPLVESLDPETAPDLVIEAYGGAHPARARFVGHTAVVAANSRGKYLGQVDFIRSDRGEWSAKYTLHRLTLDLPEDEALATAVANLGKEVLKVVPGAR